METNFFFMELAAVLYSLTNNITDSRPGARYRSQDIFVIFSLLFRDYQMPLKLIMTTSN